MIKDYKVFFFSEENMKRIDAIESIETFIKILEYKS